MTKDYSNLFVTTYITGGIGNQLFRVANVLAYAWKYSLTPIFKSSTKSLCPNEYWNTHFPRDVYWNNVFRNLEVIKKLPSKLITFNEKEIVYNKIPDPEKILSLKKSTLRKNKGIIFDGYFGSVKYFDKYREKLLSHIFYIDPLEKDYLKKKFAEIFDENIITVALHIRRGDTLLQTDRFTNLTETDYYQKSISFFEEKFSKNKLNFIIFSDDPEWSKNYMKTQFSKLNQIFPIEKDYIELYLMSCCNHQIISNSTFSWWAAYLNTFPEKIVCAPRNWFGPQGVKKHDLYIDDWIII